jgi:hypothetical protein
MKVGINGNGRRLRYALDGGKLADRCGLDASQIAEIGKQKARALLADARNALKA